MPDMRMWPTSRLLSTAARIVEHAWNERLDEIGLNHAGLIALDVLAGTGPMTQSSLAQIIRVQPQTIGKTLAHLDARGYVCRQRSESDRRSQVVSITDAGTSARQDARALERSVLATAEVDTEKLRTQLQTIVRALARSDQTT